MIRKLLALSVLAACSQVIHAQNLQGAMKVGEVYSYYKDNSCSQNCLNKSQAMEACKAIKGITKGFRSSLAPQGLSSAKRMALVEGGEIDDYEFSWKYNQCHAEVIVSGIYKGSSARIRIEGGVIRFVRTSQNEILAHMADTMGWGGD